jgi:hypothetical protein
MNQFGPIVDVDRSKPPYSNTRRLVTNYDVGGDARRAHSGVVPGFAAYRDQQTKAYKHEAVWQYLFTHPVNAVGQGVPRDPGCVKNHKQ